MRAASGPYSGAALFLDRDGTLIRDPGYLHEPDKVALLPGVAETLRALRDGGARLFLHTNQSGPARGMFPMADVLACNRRMAELIGAGEPFDGVCIADEPPGTPGGYRKPSPRFILETMAQFGLDPRRCVVVGDRRRDLESAVAAGIGAIRVTADRDDPDAAEFARSRGFPSIDDFAALAALIPLP